MKTELKLDEWQKQVLNTQGNLCLCSGRQTGKSTVISMKAGNSAIQSKKSIMIIASTERQALLLFEKVLSHIYLNNKTIIKKGKDRPTKTRLKLKNGSVIYCLPTGDSGYGIRGFTIDELYADEAHFIKEEVWAAVTPMLATTGGSINLLSTPMGNNGYFYRCFYDKKFTSIHVNTEIVAKEREEPQKTNMLEFLKDEKLRMSKLQYQQEYLGLFVGGIQRYFTEELIDNVCTLEKGTYKPIGEKFQGIDIARQGGDDTVMVSLDRIEKKKLIQFDMEITNKTYLTETTRLIIRKDISINHKKIYIDTTGMGWGVFDPLKEHPQTRKKVVAIENLKKSLDRERGKDRDTTKRTMKEDLYSNLKTLMETKKIQLYDDPELRQSLRSIQYENEDGLKIYGNFSHITESIIRAAWCIKDKSLNIYLY